MKHLGIEYSMKNRPPLDERFVPFGVWARAYLREAIKPIKIAIERENKLVYVFETTLRNDSYASANMRYVERLVKFMLWGIGGFRVYICGCEDIAERIAKIYSPKGVRSFDYQIFSHIYKRPLEIIACTEEEIPPAHEIAKQVGGHTKGCRIGFDAGGSYRKVSAVVDGEVVYSESIAWSPKTTEDPQYHFNEIVTAFETAADRMPRVDAIGVSSAGVFVDNFNVFASLFVGVPEQRRDEVRDIYMRAAHAFGDVPVTVANDGDVAALAGYLQCGSGSLLGIAMGTSEGVGYVNEDGNILGWLNELAYAPVDLADLAALDEWSKDIGVGGQYLSQDAAIRLAKKAGIELDPEATPSEKLNVIQDLAEKDDAAARDVFAGIGVYLAHTLVLYSMFYDIKILLVLGGVLSGIGGKIIVGECKRVLTDEYRDLAEQITVTIPDEETRRTGISIAAASLPE